MHTWLANEESWLAVQLVQESSKCQESAKNCEDDLFVRAAGSQDHNRLHPEALLLVAWQRGNLGRTTYSSMLSTW
jgi:hypothetical protein